MPTWDVFHVDSNTWSNISNIAVGCESMFITAFYCKEFTASSVIVNATSIVQVQDG